MHFDKVPKAVFEATELPKVKRPKDGSPPEPIPFVDRNTVGIRERLAFFRNIATSIECQGAKNIRQEALDLLAQERLGIECKGFPDANSLMWAQYSRQFGKWKVMCTFWDGKLVINMLHILAQECTYWERYQFKGEIWFVQNDGSKRIKETKCNRDDFFKWMLKRCNHHIEEYLLCEIYGFVASDKAADRMDSM